MRASRRHHTYRSRALKREECERGNDGGLSGEKEGRREDWTMEEVQMSLLERGWADADGKGGAWKGC